MTPTRLIDQMAGIIAGIEVSVVVVMLLIKRRRHPQRSAGYERLESIPPDQ
jgi:hypothetical protein